MALHVQQQVLNALAAALVAGDTAAADRVYVDRVDPVPVAKLPAIVILEADAGEEAEPASIHSLDQRTLNVEVHCVLKQCTTAAADARAFGLAVEKIVRPSTTLAALIKRRPRMTGSRPAISGAGEELVAARVQSWQFTYLVNPSAPDVVA